MSPNHLRRLGLQGAAMALAAASLFSLAACGIAPQFSAAPRLKLAQSPSSALRPQQIAYTASEPSPDPHRQYLDRRYNRFYYFDPISRRYYWESGEPK